MIHFFRHNDVVLNFYKSIAYRFDENNRDHLKDSFRCSLATFEEIDIFNKIINNPGYESDTVKLVHMFDGNGSKWTMRKEFTFCIKITDQIMHNFLKISDEIDSTDYETIFFEVLRRSTTDLPKELENKNKALRKENRELKSAIKHIKNNLKGL